MTSKFQKSVDRKFESRRFHHLAPHNPWNPDRKLFGNLAFFGNLASIWDFLTFWKKIKIEILKKMSWHLIGWPKIICVCENMVLDVFGRCQNCTYQMRFAQPDCRKSISDLLILMTSFNDTEISPGTYLFFLMINDTGLDFGLTYLLS